MPPDRLCDFCVFHSCVHGYHQSASFGRSEIAQYTRRAKREVFQVFGRDTVDWTAPRDGGASSVRRTPSRPVSSRAASIHPAHACTPGSLRSSAAHGATRFHGRNCDRRQFAGLAHLLLADAAHVHGEEAARPARHAPRRAREIAPLYTIDDAFATMSFFGRRARYETGVHLAPARKSHKRRSRPPRIAWATGTRSLQRTKR